MLGLPEEVYALISCEGEKSTSSNTTQPPHDTDDSIVATMRYKNNVIASMVTSRAGGPVNEELALYGQDGSIIVNPDSCTLRGADGQVIDHMENHLTLTELFQRQAQEFVDAVRYDEQEYSTSGEENLLTHAVINAMYLSAHTAQPESPKSQLDIHRVFPGNS